MIAEIEHKIATAPDTLTDFDIKTWEFYLAGSHRASRARQARDKALGLADAPVITPTFADALAAAIRAATVPLESKLLALEARIQEPKSLRQKSCLLTIAKGYDPQRRTFSGVATAPDVDRVGDRILSEGIRFHNPVPLLLHHRHDQPIGEAVLYPATAAGTPFDGVISTVDHPGSVADRLAEAVDSLSAVPPLIKGVSIGFLPLVEPTYDKATRGFVYPSVEIHELSLVTIPAHPQARIAYED